MTVITHYFYGGSAEVIMKIAPDNASYLLESIKSGKGMLVLGAGASCNSTNSAGLPIKMSNALAELFAKKSGLKYQNEDLVTVLAAVRGSYLSDVSIREIINSEYKNTRPSIELGNLFHFSWKRVYTWNIDDTLENINIRTSQRKIHYNGITDKVVDFEGINVNHIVHLHGQTTKPDHGFILTESDYMKALKSEKHFWYQRLAQDYLACCPIFIGSKLSEPVMFAEIERAKREGNLVAGRGYVITPDVLSDITVKSLASKGLIHIRSTLEDFQRWLAKEIPGGWGPNDVLAHSQHYDADMLHLVTSDELASAQYLKLVELSSLKGQFTALGQADQSKAARRFLQGHQPTWPIVASDIPVKLDGLDDLYATLSEAVDNHDKLFIVSGQAGSGKTTGLMAACLRHQQEHGTPVYDLSSDVKSPQKAISLLKRIQKGKVILYIGDIFVYGDNFSADLDTISGQNMIVVSTVRSGEWNEHISRYLGDRVKPYQFQRFVRKDFQPLIDRLLTYVPSPFFRSLTPEQRVKRLASSNNQLMIALRETTQSEQFNRIIVDEFRGLPDDDTRKLFVIAGLATLARVGISVGAAREAYSKLAPTRSFGRALDALEGIVSETADGRLLARHDVYVRHVLDAAVSFKELSECIVAILGTYLKYNIPVIKSVRRLDGILFKFLVNHNFIYNQAKRYSIPSAGTEIYENFDVDFQLDGHFWPQYGLFLSSIGRTPEALVMLRRSIDAYPGNPFAVHALADTQLRVARERDQYDEITRDLIGEAVASLMQQDVQTGIIIDQYPIVTLALGHIGALLKHGEHSDAKDKAAVYFRRIQMVERTVSSPIIQHAKERLLRFLTFDEWDASAFSASIPRGRPRRRSRGKFRPPS